MASEALVLSSQRRELQARTVLMGCHENASASPGAAPLQSGRAVLRYCARHGFELEPLLKRAGLTPRHVLELDQPGGRAGRLSLWRAALEVVGDPQLPLRVAATAPLGSFGPADLLCATAPTLGDALRAMAASIAESYPGLTLESSEHEERVCLTIHAQGGSERVASEEVQLLLALCAVRVCVASGCAWRAPALDLPRQVAHDARELERAFGCAVRTGQAAARLWLHRSDLTVPGAHADPALFASLEAAALHGPAVCAARDPLLVALPALMLELMGSTRVDLRRTARRLGVSTRTLQRRLAAAGTTFSRLLQQTRERQARSLLAQRERSLVEIAEQLGFSEQSAFTRAFTRWTGCPPARFRSERAPGRRRRPRRTAR